MSVTKLRIRLLLLLGVCVLATTTACSSGATSHASAGKTAPASSGAMITIDKFKFTVPSSVTPGEKITVRNEDGVAHTVTSKTGHEFDAKVGANSTATFTAPSKAGKYPFTCTYHPYMNATLVVS